LFIQSELVLGISCFEEFSPHFGAAQIADLMESLCENLLELHLNSRCLAAWLQAQGQQKLLDRPQEPEKVENCIQIAILSGLVVNAPL
jgi:hypothetical protein